MGGNSERFYNVYGVKMTSLEEMRFSKYLDNERIAMNTFHKQERMNIAKKWLYDIYLPKQGNKRH